MLDFRRVEDTDLPLLKEYSSRIRTSAYEYKPSYMILWKEAEDIHIAEGRYGLYIYQKATDTYLLPFADDLDKALKELIEGRSRVCITSCPGEYVDRIPSWFRKERSPELDDYLYQTDALIRLPGKKLSAKRNHIHQFEKNYTYTLSSIREEDFVDCLNIDKDWNQEQDPDEKESVEEERRAIENCFNHWNAFNFLGSIIKVDGRPIAFTIGEKVEDCMAIIHFEKADTSYIGIYAALNNYNLSLLFSDTQHINRQEDLGLEGLRKAKLSYHPERMGEKWKCIYEA